MFDELFAPAVASMTMDISLDIPFILALGYLITGSLITTVIADNPPTMSGTVSSQDRPSRRASQPRSSSVAQSLRRLRPLLKRRSIQMVLPIFFVGMFRMAIISVMMQYPRVRFGWKLSQVTSLFTAVAVLNLVVFLAIVPYLLQHLRTRYSTSEVSLQVALVRYSLLSTAVGCLIIGVAPSAMLLCIGIQCLHGASVNILTV
jgi:membrane protein YdbS with pleckstrin-like domain